MPGDAKLIESTSKPSRAFSAMVIATTTICGALIGELAMTSLGSRFNSDLLVASIYAERAEIAEPD